ncbi:trk system potassium uptake protein TrkH [Sinobacterium caligoides]|uniref:Trk system potassium uptake protein n=1 Tax=Sinobacterium caligoides TaxID=933926 RepID=A0A3N2DGS9_9GAMM|nr:TrkH family potassium uptake protein [Sinobacterium caligoides]ROR98995.1 trk system potassium uptake protein TrkH [Sinobacterium caligoides]
MHLPTIFRTVGFLLMLFSLTMFLPLLVSLIYQDGAGDSFVLSGAITFGIGAAIYLPLRRQRKDLRTRDGFLITALFWTVLGLFGAIPLLLSEQPSLSVTDAIFESISGLTTTGATVITGLDQLPPSMLFYRQLLQWMGGIGIIVIAIAILPMLGIGGMQLYRAETPGPVKDSKLTPRITQTAKTLFLIYLSLTTVCAVSYWLAGMTVFNAICHAFSTVAIGGFSTHDASMGYYADNPAILIIACTFMIIAGINFALHFGAFRNASISQYRRDPECWFYLSYLFFASIAVSLLLYFHHYYDFSDSFLYGVFQVISITTTTGFATTDFSTWPSLLPHLLLTFAFLGGCAGSTGGGIKMIRALLLAKQGFRELQQLIHPNAVIPLKLGNRSVSNRVIVAVWSFLSVYIMTFFMLIMALMLTGLDFISAYSAVAASLNNLGPGLGTVAAHFGDINDVAKWILCLAMLLGRLEVFTLLVLLTPAFWRR